MAVAAQNGVRKSDGKYEKSRIETQRRRKIRVSALVSLKIAARTKKKKGREREKSERGQEGKIDK